MCSRRTPEGEILMKELASKMLNVLNKDVWEVVEDQVMSGAVSWQHRIMARLRTAPSKGVEIIVDGTYDDIVVNCGYMDFHPIGEFFFMIPSLVEKKMFIKEEDYEKVVREYLFKCFSLV